MKILNIVHKGLRNLYEREDASKIPPAAANKLRKMLGFLDTMIAESNLHSVPTWNAHLLAGDRKGTWSLFVTKNWRLTFRIDDGEICDLNLEDYH